MTLDRSYSARLILVWDVIGILRQQPMSPEELGEKIGCSKRTAYRYIERIQEMGFSVDENWEFKYFIADFKCPICNKKH